MKVDELKAACLSTNELTGAARTRIYLTVRRKTLPRGVTISIAPRSGPRGQLCVVNERDAGGYDCTAVFSAPAVLKYLEANG